MQFDVDICCLYLGTKKVERFLQFHWKTQFLGLDTLFGRTRYIYIYIYIYIYTFVLQSFNTQWAQCICSESVVFYLARAVHAFWIK